MAVKRSSRWTLRAGDVVLFAIAIALLAVFPALGHNDARLGTVPLEHLAVVGYVIATVWIFARFVIPYLNYKKPSYLTLVFGAVLSILPILAMTFVFASFALS